MKERIPKKDDLEKQQKALKLLQELFRRNQHEIEPALWIGPIFNILVDTFKDSKIPFKTCRQNLLEVIDFYEYGEEDD